MNTNIIGYAFKFNDDYHEFDTLNECVRYANVHLALSEDGIVRLIDNLDGLFNDGVDGLVCGATGIVIETVRYNSIH